MRRVVPLATDGPVARVGPLLVRLLVLFLLLVPLSGCIAPNGSSAEPPAGAALVDPFDRPTSPDRSWEAMRVRISPEGAYRIALPVPVADESDVKAWSEDVHIDGTAQVSGGEERGRHVHWVEGETPVTVTWTRVKVSDDPDGCCAEDFLGSAWSTGPHVGSREDLPFVVERGVGELTLRYLARSNWCGGAEERAGTFDAHTDAVPLLSHTNGTGMMCS